MDGEPAKDGQWEVISKERTEMEGKTDGQVDTQVGRVGQFLGSGFDSASDLLVQAPLCCWCLGAMLSESSVCPLGVKGKGPSCFPVDAVDEGRARLWRV